MTKDQFWTMAIHLFVRSRLFQRIELFFVWTKLADLRISDARIGDAGDDDGARVAIRKVDSFRQLAAADGHEARAHTGAHFHSKSK